MARRTHEAVASLALGAVVLYSGWGEALSLVLPQSELCYLQGPPPGLHLSDAGMIVYTECQYTYAFAWPVLVFVSLTGLALATYGVRLYRE